MIWRHLTSTAVLLLLRIPWEGVVDVDAVTKLCRDVFPSKTRTNTEACVMVTMVGGGFTNSASVLFKMEGDLWSPNCETPAGDVSVALMVVNERGYPCGRAPASFELSSYGTPTVCYLPTNKPEWKGPWFSPKLNALHVPCFFHEAGKLDYLQPVSDTQLPSLFMFDNSKDDRNHRRFAWRYELPPNYQGSVVTAISIVGEMLHKATGKVYTFGSSGTAKLTYSPDVKQHDECEDNLSVEFIPTKPNPSTSPDYLAACDASPDDCLFPSPKKLTSSVFSCRGWKLDVERVVGSASECVSLLATATRQENAVIVGLVMDPTKGGGVCGGEEWGVEAWLLQATNENGYPVGKVDESFPVEFPPSDTCSLSGKEGDAVEIGEGRNVRCFFHDGAKEKFIQTVDESHVPTLFHGKSSGSVFGGKSLFLHIWRYAQPPGYAGRHPTELHFTAEVYFPKKQQIYVLRASTPLKFTYLPSPQENTDPNTPCFSPGSRQSVAPRPNSTPVDPNEDYLAACKASEKCPIEWVPLPEPPSPPPEIGDPEIPEIPGDQTPAPQPPLKRDRLRPSNVYTGCVEKTKECVVPPKGARPRDCLKTQTCELVIAFQRQDVDDANDDVIVIELHHVDPGEWFAVGINFDVDQPRMGDTLVLECVDEGHPEGPVVYNSYNVKGTYDNKRYAEDSAQGAQKIIQKKESYRRGREMYCRFHLAVKFTRTPLRVDGPLPPKFVDLSKLPVFVVAAWGADLSIGPRGNLRKHKMDDVMVPAGRKKSLLSARYAPTAAQRTFLLQHGVLLTWAFLFCLPVANFLARFHKETFPHLKIARRIPLWLFLHVTLMTLALALVAMAMGLEIRGHVGWVSLRSSSLHTFLGGATGGLLLANFFFGFLVRVSRHGARNLPGIAHSLFGLLVQLGAVVLILRSGDLSFGDSPCHVAWIVGAWLFSFLVAHAIMGYHYCWVDWVVGLRKGRSLAVTPIGVLTEGQVNDILLQRTDSRGRLNKHATVRLRQQDVISAPGTRVRLVGLVLFVMVSLIYSAWTTAIVVTNKRGPCVPPRDLLHRQPT